jgi:hypothetical protein
MSKRKKAPAAGPRALPAQLSQFARLIAIGAIRAAGDGGRQAQNEAKVSPLSVVK